MWVCARRSASLAVVPAVCLRGSGCWCAGGVATFVGPSGCVPFVLRAPSASLGPSGRLCEGGSSPLCMSIPLPPAHSSLEGDTPNRRGVPRSGRAGTRLCVHSQLLLCRDRFWRLRGCLWPVWVAPPFVSPFLSGGRASPVRVSAPSAVVTPSWSISLPECVLACAAPGSCRVYDFLCARFRSRVFVNVRARPVLCFVCLTSAPPVFVRVAVESGGGFPPSSRPGWGKNPALPLPLHESILPPPTQMGRGRRRRVWPATS